MTLIPKYRVKTLGPVLETLQFLVASRHQTGYAAPGRCRMPTFTASRVSPITGALMLVLGILSVPSVGPAAMQRPHCAQHGPSAVPQVAHSGGEHQMPEPTGSASWESATKHDCPHCPATECARLAPCTTSSNAAVSVTALAVTQSATHRDVFPRLQHHLYSTTHQPPTPPPQLIS
jgi:hypothetical protein